MSTIIQVEVPQDFREALCQGQGEARLPRWALEALVTEAVREGLISRGRGGEILSLSFGQRERLYAERGVTYDLTPEELDADRMALEALLGKP